MSGTITVVWLRRFVPGQRVRRERPERPGRAQTGTVRMMVGYLDEARGECVMCWARVEWDGRRNGTNCPVTDLVPLDDAP